MNNHTVICFGVRDYEVEIIDGVSTETGFDIALSKEYINDENYEIAYGYETVIIRANCLLSRPSLADLKKHGLKFLLTRTVGYNHINLEACKDLGIKVAYAPNYSPSAIAELNLSLSLSLFRDIPEAIHNSHQFDFTLNKRMFGKEIRNCVVGIIGCGRIGTATGKLYHSIGSKVLGFDIVVNKTEVNSFFEFVPLKQLLQESDIVSINMSYDKNTNYHFISERELSLMKPTSILINTARGELIDNLALIRHIQAGKLFGAGLDVVEGEHTLFFRKNDYSEVDPVLRELIGLYPKVIITPHISSSTDQAVYESMMISIDNLNDLIKKGFSKNSL